MSNKKYLSFEKRTDNPAEYKELTNSLTDKALTDSSKLSLVKASVSSNLKVMTENQAEIKIVSAEAQIA